MTNASVVDLDADFVRSGGQDLYILKGQLLAGFPGDGGLAGDGLYDMDKHDGGKLSVKPISE